MSVELGLPADFLSSPGWRSPTVCARHGKPAVENRFVRFQRRMPPWTYFLVPFGVIPFLIAFNVVQKFVEVQAWPFCARCRLERKKNILVSVCLMVGGIFIPAPVAGGLGVGGDTLLAIILLGLLIFIVGAVRMVRGTWRWSTGGFVVQGGRLVEFRKAHERFAAQATPAQQART
jgi:hypothetical protein